MKKFLTTIISLMLVLSLALVTGCNNTFAGNYKEVQPNDQALTTFAAKVEDTNGGDEIDYSTGVKISLEMDGTITSFDNKVYDFESELSMKAIAVDGKLQMQGKMVSEQGEEKSSAEMWFADNYMYMKTKTNTTEQKIKKSIDVDDFVDDMVGGPLAGLEANYSLVDLIEEYGQEISSDKGYVKFYTDINEGGDSKVKIEAKSTYEGESEITIVLVYNANNILIAYKMEAEIEMAGQEMNIDFEIRPWSGSVRLPSDLDTYNFSLI